MLADRAVIRLWGEDVRAFLQGLVTNDVAGALPVWLCEVHPAMSAIAATAGKILGFMVTSWAAMRPSYSNLRIVSRFSSGALLRRQPCGFAME